MTYWEFVYNVCVDLGEVRKNRVLQPQPLNTVWSLRRQGVWGRVLIRPCSIIVNRLSHIGLSKTWLCCIMYGLSTSMWLSYLPSIFYQDMKRSLNRKYFTAVWAARSIEYWSIQAMMLFTREQNGLWMRSGSWRGSRHFFNWPVRGQWTHSNAWTQERISPGWRVLRTPFFYKHRQLSFEVWLKNKRWLFYRRKKRGRKTMKQLRLEQQEKTQAMRMAKQKKRKKRSKLVRKLKKWARR